MFGYTDLFTPEKPRARVDDRRSDQLSQTEHDAIGLVSSVLISGLLMPVARRLGPIPWLTISVPLQVPIMRPTPR